MLFAAANALYGLYDARGKRHFFIGRFRVSARTAKTFAAMVFVLSLAGAFLIFFGPWPKT